MDREYWQKLLIADWKAMFLLLKPTKIEIKPFYEIDKLGFENVVSDDKCMIIFISDANEVLRMWAKDFKFFIYYEKCRKMTKQEILKQLNDEAKDLLKDPKYDLDAKGHWGG